MPDTDPDVIIIGGGPAGMSAALWCADLGLSAKVFESSEELGGQLLWTYNEIPNYLGRPAASGRELRDHFEEHLRAGTAAVKFGMRVTSIDGDGPRVRTSDGGEHSCRAIIVATGVRRRDPGIPGIGRFQHKGLLHSGKRDRKNVSGKVVMVIGGGDAAFENALILSETAKEVILVHRRSEFTARPEFVEQALSTGKIRTVADAVLTAVDGKEKLEQVTLKNLSTDETETVEIQSLIFRIGVVPNTEPFLDLLETDSRGYISVDSLCRTSLPAVFAAGDVANPVSPTISTAAGMGATAVKAVFSLLN